MGRGGEIQKQLLELLEQCSSLIQITKTPTFNISESRLTLDFSRSTRF